ncbi:unnamed protein product, partial [Oppiella nova]
DFVYGSTFAASGEIDIMELRGDEPGKIESTIHYGGTKPNFNSSGGFLDFHRSFADDFHTFGCIWSNTSIDFYVDDQVFHRERIDRSMYSGKGPNPYTKNGQPFDKDFQINLNLAVGGAFFDPPEITEDDARKWPQPSYVIDYVRVYKQKN